MTEKPATDVEVDHYRRICSEFMSWDFDIIDTERLIARIDAERARVKVLEAALHRIAEEQSATTATAAADHFQEIARAALKESANG